MRVRLIHWNGPEGRERALRLASLGHHVDFNAVDGPGLIRVLRGGGADVYVIDLSRSPAQGRDAALWLRSQTTTRQVPIVFVDGSPDKTSKIRALLPDAAYTTWPAIAPALADSAARPPTNPVVPPPLYSTKPALEKLGVKTGMRVCAVRAPQGLIDTLGPAPAAVRFTATPSAACDLFIAFARTRREVLAHLDALVPHVARQTLWIAWPKKAAGSRSDVDGNVVRSAGLAAGWVDYKVCSLDATWSALGFKRRRPTLSGRSRV